ncbi:MAG: hypothetical protein KME20_05255 [Kaiparowitsia implicata GSE-PSE-MK54-09C]|jgi:hypothetical protein|nr:hypothetical protein [Kaiparowitsia implicata GSE-PSE-MK54-09C]
MTPLERLNTGLKRSKESGCEDSSRANQSQQDYEQQADEADRQLREKQARELRRFWG